MRCWQMSFLSKERKEGGAPCGGASLSLEPTQIRGAGRIDATESA
jgi:hypothetical protein